MSRQDRFSWFGSQRRRKKRKRRHSAPVASPQAKRLHLELLELRHLLTITVDTLVDENDGSGMGTGTSLRDAIAEATPGETIDFSVTGTINLSLGQLTIDKDLTIAGPGADQLTIDGGAATRLFNVNDGDGGLLQDVLLSGLTLANARTPTVSSGGAISSRENLSIEDSILTGNVSQSAGGAIRQFDGSLTVTDSEITYNDADRYSGGGIAFTGPGDLTITNTLIANNDANALYALTPGGGGLIFDGSGTLTITDSTINDNTASASGGGISALNAAAVNITDSTISGNRTSAADADGGGIFFQSSGTLSVLSSTITDNTTERDGGGLYARYASSVSIDNSTISSNTSAATNGDGAGLFLWDSTSTVTGSTVSGNTANDDGGGVYVFSGSAVITNTTISGNNAYDDAGGLFSVSGGAITLEHSTVTLNVADADSSAGGMGGGMRTTGTITLDHTIVAGNTDVGTDPDIDGNVAASYSFIGDDTGATITDNGGNQIGTGASPIDPMLGPLQDNGGPTYTHALLAGSTAIDAGDPAVVSAPFLDQRGSPFVRVFDDPVASGTAIDIGAYERQTIAGLNLTVDILTDEADGMHGPGDLSLREAIKLANGSVGTDAIDFDNSLAGGSIDLTLGQLEVNDDLTVTGLGSSQLTIDGQFNSALMTINQSATTQISRLTFAHGSVFGAPAAGGLTNFGTTTLESVVIQNNRGGGGGGIRNEGDLTITGSTITGNSSDSGGGVYNRGFYTFQDFAQLTITDTTISDNSDFLPNAGAGGGVYSLNGDAIINDSTISGTYGSY